MKKHIAHIALLVDDYDKAIHFFVEKLNFVLVENTLLEEGKRWVLISPSKSNEFSLLLAKADGEEQQKAIGNQSGGRVFLFLKTDDFTRDYNNLVANNIKIIREPINQEYGTVAVFEDLYGNQWDLIQPK